MADTAHPETGTDPARAAQFLTTEHFTLTSVRVATIYDANGRTALYLAAVSSALIALAFIGRISHLDTAFDVFGFVAFAGLFFVGLVTFARVLQVSLEEMIYAQAIARVRRYYVARVPEIAPYLMRSPMSDDVGNALTMGILPSRWQLALTQAGMVGVIDSVVAGGAGGFAVRLLLAAPLPVCMGVGLTLFLVSVAAHHHYEVGQWRRAGQRLQGLFPPDASDGGAASVCTDDRSGVARTETKE